MSDANPTPSLMRGELFLISARKSRSGDHWADDDYDVRLANANGEVVGRIFRTPQSPPYQNWFWTITARVPQRPTDRGYAGTREEAMVGFRQAWEESNWSRPTREDD
jgi:hypothetical protein